MPLELHGKPTYLSTEVSTSGERDPEKFKKALEIVISGEEGPMAHALFRIAGIAALNTGEVGS